MNWGIINKRSFSLFLFAIVSCCYVMAIDFTKGKHAGEDVIVISDGNTKELIAKSGKTLFQVQAKYDGVVTIESSSLSEEVGLVTVFSSDYKTIVTQNLHRKEDAISFISRAGEVYYIIWQLKQDGIDLKWSVKQLEEKGISSSNAVVASVGLMEANHTKGYDSWFVYTAEHNGKVAFSSYGLTSENTCLFVYDKTCEVVVGSSNFTKGTLQSEVVVDVQKGEIYYIKWSNAFTDSNYKWTLAYL
ncbi:MAG: hypothetical protein MI866_22815 [Bacteroidales bacterium]|nr:hypothetical protein [Bacteroidales bacterium]